MNIEFNDFGLEWDHGDGVKHKADYDDLIKAYEQTRWIPVSERLPEERDSIFAKFKGTDKWKNGMFEKTSSTVIVTVCSDNGSRRTTTAKTIDGRWETDIILSGNEVIAWMPLPEYWKGECACTVMETANFWIKNARNAKRTERLLQS